MAVLVNDDTHGKGGGQYPPEGMRVFLGVKIAPAGADQLIWLAKELRVERVRIVADGARGCPIDRKLFFTQRMKPVELFRSPPPDATGYKILASAPLTEASPRLGRTAGT